VRAKVGRLQTHEDVLECAAVAWLDGDDPIKLKAFAVLIPHRIAQNRDRKNPALQIAS
jgi:hypothetical protein